MIRILLEKFLLCCLLLLLAFVCALGGVYYAVRDDLPRLPESLKHINFSSPTEIYDKDGRRIKALGERRPVSLREISPNFLRAIVAVEDGRFYVHHGLDHVSLLRAFYANLRERRITQGGSTITQQLSKNLFFPFEKKWVRKIKELLVALQMETAFGKDEILETYCNQIYFGNGAYGIEEASKVYFGKQAKDLTPLQGAILAAIPHSPNNVNPFSGPERSRERARYVLERMVAEKTLSEAEKEAALRSEPALVPAREQMDSRLYFVDYVINEAERDYGKELVHFGGIKIFTTLDSQLQEFAQGGIDNHLQTLEKKGLKKTENESPLQAALLAIENQTGAVRTMVGGRNYSFSQFNRAVSNNRLPGSSFKPFVYLGAIEFLGYTPGTVVVDEPITIPIPGSTAWEPANFDDGFLGKIILKKALTKSVNIISAKLVQRLTPERVIQIARRLGIQSPLGNHLSLALGTSPVSPLEMAAAYSVIADLGAYHQPYFVQRIEDFQGNRLYEHFWQREQRFAPQSVYPLVDMMQAVVDEGTGSIVRKMGFDHPAAGKTGTTNEHKDAWFIGFTRDLTAATWVGRDNNEPMIGVNGRGLTGGQAAAPIWALFMQKAMDGKGKIRFPVPDGVVFLNVDMRTGKIAGPTATETMRIAVRSEDEGKFSGEPLSAGENAAPAPAAGLEAH